MALAIAGSDGTIGASPFHRYTGGGGWMEDDGYIELQGHYGGQYVVLRGREVLVNSASYDDIEDWLDRNRLLHEGVSVTFVARPDGFAIY